MTNQPVTIPHENLTFEKVWAALMELKTRQEEVTLQMKETDRQIKETDRQMKETDRQMKETDRKFGELHNRFGELAEHMVTPSIREKFNELGFNFSISSENIDIKIPGNPTIYAEIDILLENGDIVIAIEVKVKPKVADITQHLKRMEIIRKIASKKNDNRKYQGAIAGAIMSESIRNLALKNGLYVIEQSGDTVKINIPEGFRPREW